MSVRSSRSARLRPDRHIDPRPLIAHVVFRFDYGGLENGLVNLVNRLPAEQFRHAVIALTQASDFARRIRREGATVHALHKRPGKDPQAYWRLFRLLRSLRPAIVHTRNFGTLDCTLTAGLARVPCRIHGEHGWDVYDPDGERHKYRLARRGLSPLIDEFVAVSRDLEHWLVERVGISARKVIHICNGVDTNRFRPAARASRSRVPEDWRRPEIVVIGTVTRFAQIKDPLNLVRAFIELRREPIGRCARLLMVGDGELKGEAEALLKSAGAHDAAWLPGAREDIPELLREVDIFVLGSKREGISNTILEAMASGLPVVATATGGNRELVRDGVSGRLVPPGDLGALARTLCEYVGDAARREAHGRAARVLTEQEYSLDKMIGSYGVLYERHVARLRRAH